MSETVSRRGVLQELAGLATMCAAPAWSQRSTTLVPAGDPHLTVEGRSALGADGRLGIGFPGVTLHFVADGSRIVLKLSASSPDCYLDIGVDDRPPRAVRLQQGDQDLVLSEGLGGRHRYRVLKRTESWQGVIAIAGITGASHFESVTLPARKLMFIGDSITCGASADVIDRASTVDGASVCDGAKSFGYVLAQRLKASCHLVSYGGRGVVRDWQGIRDISNAPIFYERALPDSPKPIWDAARYVPDAIGICLGTNDFNQGIPDQNEFVNGYVEFVRKVRRDAPAAAIFLIGSPMTIDGAELGHRRTILYDYLDEVAGRIDLPLVKVARIAHYPGRPSNSHPIAADHVAIADELEQRFRAATGWTA